MTVKHRTCRSLNGQDAPILLKNSSVEKLELP
jgi:hypothetical protein